MLHKYPYTDLHEINLDWIISEVKRVTEEWIAYKKAADAKFDSIEAAFKDLKDYVINYFDRTDFKQLVADEIEKYIDDGTISAMVTGEINLVVALGLKKGEDINSGNRLDNFFNANPGRTFYMPAGEWLVNTTIQISQANGMTLHSDNGAIYYTEGLPIMIVMSDWLEKGPHYTGIKGGTFNAHLVTDQVIVIRNHFLQPFIDGIEIYNLEGNCIGIQVGAINAQEPNLQALITNTTILGYSNHETEMNGYGMAIYGTDGHYSNIAIVNCRHGIHDVTGGNKLTNIHIATSQDAYNPNASPEELNDIFAIGARGCQIDNVQIDNYYIGFKVWSSQYNPYDVRINNYVYNVQTRSGTIFPTLLTPNRNACAIYEVLETNGVFHQTSRLSYNLKIYAAAGVCVRSHYMQYTGIKTVLNYNHKYVSGLNRNTSWIDPTSCSIMPLTDESFRVYAGDGCDISSYYTTRSSKYGLVGYIGIPTTVSSYYYYANFKISIADQIADIKIKMAGNNPTINVDKISPFTTSKYKIAIDPDKLFEYNHMRYIPIYLSSDAAGYDQASINVVIENMYMPGGLYMAKGKALNAQIGISDTFVQDTLSENAVIANLY